MEFENDVKAVVAEMAEALNKNYSDQKLFDLSLGERLPQRMRSLILWMNCGK